MMADNLENTLEKNRRQAESYIDEAILNIKDLPDNVAESKADALFQLEKAKEWVYRLWDIADDISRELREKQRENE